jgi:hypothetical protein
MLGLACCAGGWKPWQAIQARTGGSGTSGESGPARCPARTAQDMAEQSGVEETAEGARRALVAPPGGKKVPATVTAGTEVWGVSHRSARCDCSFRRPAPTRIDLNQTDLIPSSNRPDPFVPRHAAG